MKKIIFTLSIIALCNANINAQLYSSGNNTIAGNSVGMGTSTPIAGSTLHLKRASSGNMLYMENSNSTASLSMKFVNDNPSKYANFTKYGSGVAGGYAGISTMYPYANTLGFGNNGAMLNASSGNLGFAISKAGSYKLKIHIDAATERLGLGGNAAPSASVHINTSYASDTLKITNATTGHLGSDGFDIMNTGNEAFIYNRENAGITFGTDNTSRMKINATGTISIGTTPMPSGYKLYVEEGILTEKIKVAIKSSANWSDYVFADNYTLAPLSQVEAYLQEHKHLPGIPSVQEVVNNGLDLAAMDSKLLGKIEELTLYIIKMEKEIELLKKANATQPILNNTK